MLIILINIISFIIIAITLWHIILFTKTIPKLSKVLDLSVKFIAIFALLVTTNVISVTPVPKAHFIGPLTITNTDQFIEGMRPDTTLVNKYSNIRKNLLYPWLGVAKYVKNDSLPLPMYNGSKIRGPKLGYGSNRSREYLLGLCDTLYGKELVWWRENWYSRSDAQKMLDAEFGLVFFNEDYFPTQYIERDTIYSIMKTLDSVNYTISLYCLCNSRDNFSLLTVENPTNYPIKNIVVSLNDAPSQGVTQLLSWTHSPDIVAVDTAYFKKDTPKRIKIEYLRPHRSIEFWIKSIYVFRNKDISLTWDKWYFFDKQLILSLLILSLALSVLIAYFEYLGEKRNSVHDNEYTSKDDGK